MKHPVLLLFILLSLLHLIGEAWQYEPLIFLTKPLLMLTLAVWFYRTVWPHGRPFSGLIMGAILFSLLGDSLLMLVNYGPASESFFLPGLLAFLLAQLCYAMAFYSLTRGEEPRFLVRPARAGRYGLIFAALLFVLWPYLEGAMQLAVPIYAAAIAAMLFSVINLKGRLPSRIYAGLWFGAMLFVLSDTLIAWNRFVSPLAWAGLSVMSTYLAAQGLLIYHSARAVGHRSVLA